jgi:hypothetical protein
VIDVDLLVCAFGYHAATVRQDEFVEGWSRERCCFCGKTRRIRKVETEVFMRWTREE